MLVRVLRRLTLEEVEERLRNLERSHGTTFDEFEETFLTQDVGQYSLDDYFVWANLVHAHHGYLESGELECVMEELYDLSPKDLRVFTPKRLELVYMLSGLKAESINNLAQKVRRNVKNVYQDLQLLKKLRLINFRKKGKRNFVPEVLVEEITLLMR